jgi:hypothetical protein
MKVPSNILSLKKRVIAEVSDDLASHRPQDSCLLLDSTGPSFTRQYIVLNAIGAGRLADFAEIHAFSGSVYALFGFMAFAAGKNLVSVDALCHPAAERMFRDQHHAGRLPGLRSVARLLAGRPAFASVDPVLASLEYMFGDFVERPFSDFGDNIHVYLASAKDAPLLVLSNNARCSPELLALRDMPVKHVIAMAANVPMVYGGVREGTPYFDPVYTDSYLPELKRIASGSRHVLVSTPWRSGQKENRRYLNCYPKGNARWLMLKDFMRLVGGRRNVSWSRDIYAAFKVAA